MLTNLLNKFAEDLESLILCLTVKISVVDLLQDNRVAPVAVDLVEGEIRSINTGFLLVKSQDFIAA